MRSAARPAAARPRPARARRGRQRDVAGTAADEPRQARPRALAVPWLPLCVVAPGRPAGNGRRRGGAAARHRGGGSCPRWRDRAPRAAGRRSAVLSARVRTRPLGRPGPRRRVRGGGRGRWFRGHRVEPCRVVGGNAGAGGCVIDRSPGTPGSRSGVACPVTAARHGHARARSTAGRPGRSPGVAHAAGRPPPAPGRLPVTPDEPRSGRVDACGVLPAWLRWTVLQAERRPACSAGSRRAPAQRRGLGRHVIGSRSAVMRLGPGDRMGADRAV